MIVNPISTFPDWMDRAKCLGHEELELFFPKRDDNAGVKRAKEFCRGCPVTVQCLAWALAHEANTGTSYRAGVYGGTSAYERRHMNHKETA